MLLGSFIVFVRGHASLKLVIQTACKLLDSHDKQITGSEVQFYKTDNVCSDAEYCQELEQKIESSSYRAGIDRICFASIHKLGSYCRENCFSDSLSSDLCTCRPYGSAFSFEKQGTTIFLAEVYDSKWDSEWRKMAMCFERPAELDQHTGASKSVPIKCWEELCVEFLSISLPTDSVAPDLTSHKQGQVMALNLFALVDWLWMSQLSLPIQVTDWQGSKKRPVGDTSQWLLYCLLLTDEPDICIYIFPLWVSNPIFVQCNNFPWSADMCLYALGWSLATWSDVSRIITFQVVYWSLMDCECCRALQSTTQRICWRACVSIAKLELEERHAGRFYEFCRLIRVLCLQKSTVFVS